MRFKSRGSRAGVPAALTVYVLDTPSPTVYVRLREFGDRDETGFLGYTTGSTRSKESRTLEASVPRLKGLCRNVEPTS